MKWPKWICSSEMVKPRDFALRHGEKKDEREERKLTRGAEDGGLDLGSSEATAVEADLVIKLRERARARQDPASRESKGTSSPTERAKCRPAFVSDRESEGFRLRPRQRGLLSPTSGRERGSSGDATSRSRCPKAAGASGGDDPTQGEGAGARGGRGRRRSNARGGRGRKGRARAAENDLGHRSFGVKYHFITTLLSVVHNDAFKRRDGRRYLLAPAPSAGLVTLSSSVGKKGSGNSFFTVVIVYEVDQQQYQSVFYNGTIEVVEVAGFVSIESVFLFTLGVAVIALVGLWAYGLIHQFSNISCF